MRNCVTYRSRPEAPVLHRARRADSARSGDAPTKIVAYDQERVVARVSVGVPVSKHPVDSINLADPRLGLMDSVNELLQKGGSSTVASTCSSIRPSATSG